MLWVMLAVSAALCWAVVEIIDKFVIDKEMKDPVMATAISGVVTMLIMTLLAMFGPKEVPDVGIIIIAVLTGMIMRAGVVFYYRALESAAVSTVTPILCTESLFVVLFALFFLGERFGIIT